MGGDSENGKCKHMTVRELIQELSKHSPETMVLIDKGAYFPVDDEPPKHMWGPVDRVRRSYDVVDNQEMKAIEAVLIESE